MTTGRSSSDRKDRRPAKVRSEKSPVPLSHLAAGTVGRLQGSELAKKDSALLRALGLTSRSVIRVCKAGDPCIVQVRATRIGIAREVAESILVVPEATR